MNYESESNIKRLQNIVKIAITQFDVSDWALIATTLPFGHLVTDHDRLIWSYNSGDGTVKDLSQIDSHGSDPVTS